MKRTILSLLVWYVTLYASAQVGIANKALSLQDNSFVGILWEPTGTVNYQELNGEGSYGLVISLNTSDTYLDIEAGHKVSIEFTDETREIYPVQLSEKSYDNTIVSHQVVSNYTRRILIFPNYESLTTKQIKRIVIQRNNGKVWIIETKPKRGGKLIKEFAEAMSEAYESYKTKVSNDSYFNE